MGPGVIAPALLGQTLIEYSLKLGINTIYILSVPSLLSLTHHVEHGVSKMKHNTADRRF